MNENVEFKTQYMNTKQDERDKTTVQTVSMKVKCIGEECVNCPQLDIEIHRDVLFSLTESVCANYLSCTNLGMCLRIKEHLRKNSNSDNEKDGV